MTTKNQHGYDIRGTRHPQATYSVTRVPLNKGGYDRSGRYWGATFGAGDPIGFLYRCERIDMEGEHIPKGLTLFHVRAWSRIGARAKCFEVCPSAVIIGSRS